MKFQNIILYIGSNDITQDKNESDIIKNIIDFISMLRANFKKTNIFFISIFKSPDRTSTQLNKIDYINKKIRDYAMTTQRFFVYNFNRQLISKNNFMEDKKHLSEKGYQTLSNCIKKLFLL
jgi:lysophospholipase L1-like esterase